MKKSRSELETIAPMLCRVAWILFVIAAFATILLFGINLPVKIAMLYCGLWLALLITTIMVAWRVTRVTRQRSFLLVLAEAVERQIPLIPAIQAFGQEHWFWWNRAKRLSQVLAGGVPLADALRRVGGCVPRESMTLIETGQRTGRLAGTLRLGASHGDQFGPVWEDILAKVFYLVVLIFVFLYNLSLIMINIIPAFQKIFSDFDAEMPALTQMLMDATHFLAVAWPLMLPLLMAFFALLCYGAACYVGLSARDAWGTRWIFRRLDAANVLDSLAMAAEAREPLPTTLADLALQYPKPSIRRRLRETLLAVNAGRPWTESLAANRFVRPVEAVLLRSAAQAGNLPWAMREMADGVRRRTAYRFKAAVQVVFPLFLGAMGLLVGFYVTALFLPLIKLIESLSC